jgi:hypothetical protein
MSVDYPSPKLKHILENYNHSIGLLKLSIQTKEISLKNIAPNPLWIVIGLPKDRYKNPLQYKK